MKVEYREDEKGQKFPFVDVGSENHGRSSFRLWVASRLLTKNKEGIDELVFPVRNAKITKTEKGSFVMRSTEGFMVHDVFVHCGYRGSSSLKIIEPMDIGTDSFPYCVYSSQTGSLGTSNGALVNVLLGKMLKIQYHRSGRRIDQPDGIMLFLPSGEIKEIEGIVEGEDLPT